MTTCTRRTGMNDMDVIDGKPVLFYFGDTAITDPTRGYLSGRKLTVQESIDLYVDGEDFFDEGSKEYYDRMTDIIEYYKEHEVK